MLRSLSQISIFFYITNGSFFQPRQKLFIALKPALYCDFRHFSIFLYNDINRQKLVQIRIEWTPYGHQIRGNEILQSRRVVMVLLRSRATFILKQAS